MVLCIMKRKLAIVLALVVSLCTACSGNSNNKDNNSVNSSAAINASTETKTEVTTSVDTYNKYAELFDNAKDDSDYMSKYGSGEGSHGFGDSYYLDNHPEDGNFYYDGKPIELKFSYSTEVPSTVGVIICVNGMPQRYTTDFSDELLYVHTDTLTKEEKYMTVYFEPSIGSSGDKLNLNVFAVRGAAYRPLGPHDPMQPEGWTGSFSDYVLNMQADSVNKQEEYEALEIIDYTESELKSYIKVNHEGVLINQLESAQIRNSFTRLAIEDGKFTIQSEVGGGDAGRYYVSAFLNGRLLKTYTADLKNLKSRALLRDTFEVTDDMIKEYNIEDYNFLYILAVPENRAINGGLHLTASGMLVSGLEVLK